MINNIGESNPVAKGAQKNEMRRRRVRTKSIPLYEKAFIDE